MAYRLLKYEELLKALIAKGYLIAPIKDFYNGASQNIIFLRHDVDRKPRRALDMAIAENRIGVRTTYYFRCDSRGRFNEEIIARIADLGHEIGYHYETLSRTKGDSEKASELFESELSNLRKIAEVVTVSAHGSPASKFSNMGYSGLIDYAHHGLKGEATLDMDFNKTLYVTDTGGKFGSKYNLRDKVKGMMLTRPFSPTELADWLSIEDNPLVLMNTHPERWPAGHLSLISAKLLDFSINTAKRLLKRTRE